MRPKITAKEPYYISKRASDIKAQETYYKSQKVPPVETHTYVSDWTVSQ